VAETLAEAAAEAAAIGEAAQGLMAIAHQETLVEQAALVLFKFI
jgi:hypothetical protein